MCVCARVCESLSLSPSLPLSIPPSLSISSDLNSEAQVINIDCVCVHVCVCVRARACVCVLYRRLEQCAWLRGRAALHSLFLRHLLRWRRHNGCCSFARVIRVLFYPVTNCICLVVIKLHLCHTISHFTIILYLGQGSSPQPLAMSDNPALVDSHPP